jgi:hypothetical protein
MSWFRNPNAKPDYTGLQIQTSTSILPIPIVWGQNKLAGNVLWYDNFKTSNGSGGKGGLLGANSNVDAYSADVIIGLSEGPVSGIGYVWKDQSVYILSDLGLNLVDGYSPQSAWSYVTANYPNQALGYQGVAYVCAPSYQLGDTASLGNHNLEVYGAFRATGFNQTDADPAQVIYDFLTNPQYGCGFNPASINMTTLYGSGGDASLQSYCRSLGICFSPVLSTQEQASSILTRWLQILNCAAVWSQGELKFIPYGDTPVLSGSVAQTLQIAVPYVAQASGGRQAYPLIELCSAAAWVSDGGVVYAFTNVALTYTSTNPPTAAGTYSISPNGIYTFAQGDVGAVVRITFTSNNPNAYVPNMTPVYSLTDLDFVDEESKKDPVTVSRADPFSLPNIQRIEVSSRSNQYGTVPVEARDQSQIELYGPRVGATITAHEICDEVRVAPVVAQTLLQRGLYVRAKFMFKLSAEYCLLDPMDIVEITDANLGMNAYPVRVISIEEDDKGLLAFECEELTVGISSAVLYGNAGTSGYQSNQGATADPVNTPLIYEPPTALSGGVAQVWVGASGGLGGVNDPNWGGANVFLSVDNVTYSQIATITQSLRQGTLTASLAAATGWDTTDTLAVNLTKSAGVLSGTSQASAQSGSTLTLVDSELIAYETATLTSIYNYNITNMARGLYGTTGASHSSGAQFARLDGAVVKFNLPQQYIGATLYFKFQSFNVFGVGVEALSACTAYTYTPTGNGALDPIAQQLETGFPVDLGQITGSVVVLDDFGQTVGGALSIIDLGVA